MKSGALVVLLAGLGSAQVTQRVSVSYNGQQASLGAEPSPGVAMSDNGRWVLFWSVSGNLVQGDNNVCWDVFLRDVAAGTTTRVSVSSGGLQGNANSGIYGIWMSADGRYAAFESAASNLVPGDTNGCRDAFIRDIANGTTERVSLGMGGVQGDGNSLYPSLSADGRYVAFTGIATNLVPGDTNGCSDTFVRDRVAGTTERVSVSTSGVQGDTHSYRPAISADGRIVAFESLASNLVPGDTNGHWDIFVHDRLTGTTDRVSVVTGGGEGDLDSAGASISADGRFVMFTSWADNLVPGDTNGYTDAFVHDRLLGTTERVSIGENGVQGNYFASAGTISGDGRYAAFLSGARNLIVGDANGTGDLFVRDRLTARTEIVSLTTGGAQGNNGSGQAGCITADGRYVYFASAATNFVQGDTNGQDDMFVHDRFATGFTSLCDPGASTVAVCPCANPAAGPARGCDNSAGTGGASISASGIAYFSIDSLVFSSDGEPPGALSILVQGNAVLAHGVVYGQGVRCVGGTTKRLFTKTASGGRITAPDLGAGDPTVSARSAALGDVIQPGRSRWYLVYYRDPIVLGGCPASSTFNATQTGQITWWP
ncbi:MAG TPA: calcium-binding protein [Planctomycetota bacterium]|jgi:Tol biopolymer transport system component|nr:calcium-binding protein [Planctomycetota bacterium]